jgi:hypothetical protein
MANKNKENESLQGQGNLSVDTGYDKASEANQEQQLQLTELLTKSADQRALDDKKRREQRKYDEVQLRGGEVVKISDLLADAVDQRQPYEAIFPNSNPFFREIFRLMGLDEADASKYNKPGIVGRNLVILIYLRFSQGETLVSYLRAKAVPNGIRTAKFFQFLNAAGIEKAKQFRDEAIEMMQQFNANEWYPFYRAFGKRFRIPVQLNAFGEVTT